jgi:hypothetical protein
MHFSLDCFLISWQQTFIEHHMGHLPKEYHKYIKFNIIQDFISNVTVTMIYVMGKNVWDYFTKIHITVKINFQSVIHILMSNSSEHSYMHIQSMLCLKDNVSATVKQIIILLLHKLGEMTKYFSNEYWDEILCRLMDLWQCFEWMYCLHLQV